MLSVLTLGSIWLRLQDTQMVSENTDLFIFYSNMFYNNCKNNSIIICQLLKIIVKVVSIDRRYNWHYSPLHHRLPKIRNNICMHLSCNKIYEIIFEWIHKWLLFESILLYYCILLMIMMNKWIDKMRAYDS